MMSLGHPPEISSTACSVSEISVPLRRGTESHEPPKADECDSGGWLKQTNRELKMIIQRLKNLFKIIFICYKFLPHNLLHMNNFSTIKGHAQDL